MPTPSCLCRRCGVSHSPNQGTPGGAYYKDCRPEAARFGWYEQPENLPRGNSVRKAA